MMLFYPMLLRTHIIPSVGEVCVKDIAPEKATKAESIKRSFILMQEKELQKCGFGLCWNTSNISRDTPREASARKRVFQNPNSNLLLSILSQASQVIHIFSAHIKILLTHLYVEF